MNYKKNSREEESKGKKYTFQEFDDSNCKALSILNFIKKYNLDLTPEAIGYHMKTNKIDWMQPSRDRFVLLTDITKNFYKIND